MQIEIIIISGLHLHFPFIQKKWYQLACSNALDNRKSCMLFLAFWCFMSSLHWRSHLVRRRRTPKGRSNEPCSSWTPWVAGHHAFWRDKAEWDEDLGSQKESKASREACSWVEAFLRSTIKARLGLCGEPTPEPWIQSPAASLYKLLFHSHSAVATNCSAQLESAKPSWIAHSHYCLRLLIILLYASHSKLLISCLTDYWGLLTLTWLLPLEYAAAADRT